MNELVIEEAGTDTQDGARRFRIAPPSPGQAVGLVLALLFLAGAVGYMVGGDRPPGRSSADVGFLQDMTTHHDQAVEMANLVVERAAEPLVRTFAREVLITQRYELGLMSAWLGEWGYGFDADRAEAMAWMGVPIPPAEMPGMASAVQMDALRRAEGRQVDALFLSMMTQHHWGGVDMAAAALSVVEDPDVRALAEAIARNQLIEINEYRAARQRLGL